MPRNLVGRLAAAVGAAVNEQQRLGVTLQPPLGQGSGSALFAFGPARALPHASNVRDAGGQPIGSVALTIANPVPWSPATTNCARTRPCRQLAAHAPDRRQGQPGRQRRRRRRHAHRLRHPGLQAGDRFLLQPVTRAANGMALLIDDPRELAAAAPLVPAPARPISAASPSPRWRCTWRPCRRPGPAPASPSPTTTAAIPGSCSTPPTPRWPAAPAAGRPASRCRHRRWTSTATRFR